jgi:hypothetical protein
LVNNNVTSSLTVYGNTIIPSGIWTHLVVTYNGNKQWSGAEFYVNSVLCAKTGVLNTLGNNTILNNAKFMVGGLNEVGSWNGDLDEMMLFTKVLTQAEVTQIYNMS